MGEWFWPWWDVYKANREHIVPLLTFVAAVGVAWAALKQASNSTRQAQTAAAQAEIARKRHEEQIKTDQERADADRQRRITESFIKAVEQLGSDKLQVRLGGIYTLERISRESPSDHKVVMEVLTAFVRERAHWKDDGTVLPETVTCIHKEKSSQQPRLPADIAAILTVIMRRSDKNRELEEDDEVEYWQLDLRRADLRGADLTGAHLERALLEGARLERAILWGVHMEAANLTEAHMEGAILTTAHMDGADLTGAHLEGTRLMEVQLEAANLVETHLEGADLRKARGLEQDQLDQAFGNAETKLPEGLTRPAHWPQ